MRKHDNSAYIRCTKCYNSYSRNLTVPFRQTSKQQGKDTERYKKIVTILLTHTAINNCIYHQLHASMYVFPRDRFRETYNNASISPTPTTKKNRRTRGGGKRREGWEHITETNRSLS